MSNSPQQIAAEPDENWLTEPPTAKKQSLSTVKAEDTPLSTALVVKSEPQTDIAALRRKMAKGNRKEEKGSSQWHYLQVVKSEEYFRETCRLPGQGIDPVKDGHYADTKKLTEQFGPHSVQNGFKLPKKDDPNYPHEVVLRLCAVVDGHPKPVNDRMTVSFARGLYCQFHLGLEVNWARFAHDKHLNQLRQRWRNPEHPEPPTLAPWVRSLATYTVDPVAETVDESTAQEVEPSLTVANNCDPAQHHSEVLEPLETGIVVSFPEKESGFQISTPVVAPASTIATAEPRDLKPAHSKTQYELDLLAAIQAQSEQQGINLRHYEDLLAKLTLPEIESTLAHVKEQHAKSIIETGQNQAYMDELNSDIQKAEEEHKDNILEQEGLQENSGLGEEEMESQASNLKLVEKQITEELSKVYAIKEQTEIHLRLLLDLSERLSAEVKEWESKLQLQTHEKTILESDMAEIREINNALLTTQKGVEDAFFWTSEYVCAPVPIPTTLGIEQPIHHVHPCPVCHLGYHCYNWIPAPCGHSYHPACLFAILNLGSRVPMNHPPKCKACRQVFHPDWLASWGYNAKHFEVTHLDLSHDLQGGRELMFQKLVQFFTKEHFVASTLYADDDSGKIHRPKISLDEYKIRSQPEFIADRHATAIAKIRSLAAMNGTPVKGTPDAGQFDPSKAIVVVEEKEVKPHSSKRRLSMASDGEKPGIIDFEAISGSVSKSNKKSKGQQYSTATGPRRRSGRNQSTSGVTTAVSEFGTTDESPCEQKEINFKKVQEIGPSPVTRQVAARNKPSKNRLDF